MGWVWVEFWSSRGWVSSWVRVEFGLTKMESHQMNDKSKNISVLKSNKPLTILRLVNIASSFWDCRFWWFSFSPLFSAHFFFFSTPMKIYFHLKFFLKDHTARRMTKVLWDSWVISHVSNAREIRQYIGSRCVMCWRLDHYHHQLRIFTLWSFVTDLQQ